MMRIERRTRETEIALRLRLPGSGRVKLDLEPYFLRHMLESFAIQGGLDLAVQATGEDEHHLIEDVGICLGQAIRQAVPGLSIERYGHAVVPMDDALVLVALDLVERPYARIELPDPLYTHFLRSTALEGRFTLHVRSLAGEDPHHVVEAAFKGFGRALRDAVRLRDQLSSAKGEVEWR
jgi:imidazoleglycerol-phosphate dehydratase